MFSLKINYKHYFHYNKSETSNNMLTLCEVNAHIILEVKNPKMEKLLEKLLN